MLEQWGGATAGTTATFHNKYNLKSYLHSSPTLVNLLYPALYLLPLRASPANDRTGSCPAEHQCQTCLSANTTGRSWSPSPSWAWPSTRVAQTGPPSFGPLSRLCDWLCWWRIWWVHCSPRRLWISATSESSEPEVSHCWIGWEKNKWEHHIEFFTLKGNTYRILLHCLYNLISFIHLFSSHFVQC